MINTVNKDAILPLDLASIRQLLDAPVAEFSPLNVTIRETTADFVEIDINTAQCDSDSIQITTHANQLIISATANVQFLDTSHSSPFQLTRQCEKTIDLPEGVDTTKIRSQLNDTNMVLHIPFLA
jgi:HSP20 family molecular chaperone IbpA